MLDDAAEWLPRLVGRLEQGDLTGAVTELGGDPAAAGGPAGDGAGVPAEDPAADRAERGRWGAVLALLQGRLATCERLLGELDSTGAGAGPATDAVLLAALRREQGRPAEAETVLRVALDGDPAPPATAQAFGALLVAEMGRDTVARAELDRLLSVDPGGPGLVTTAACAEVAAVVGLFAEADSLHRILAAQADRFVVDRATGLCLGSAARHLGRLSHVLGRSAEAVAHFDRALDAHLRAGAPLLVAHTSRQLAAVLRVWGDDDEWDRALHLLHQAATIYRRLGVDAAAADAQAVLARSDDLDLPLDWSSRRGVFHPEGDGWLIGVDGATRHVPAVPGFDDLARLLSAPRTALHVADLLAGRPPSDPRSRTDRPWFWPQRPRAIDDEGLDQLIAADAGAAYEHRLAALPGELAAAEAAGDTLEAAVVRAEHDVLAAELAELRQPEQEGRLRPTPLERARRIVTTRIRLAVDRVEQIDPAAGRHLRNAIRTGTFCSYEPQRELTWLL